ncbi:MAG: HYR domain-containing protein, partial [Bacteroidetes bacterium]
MNRRLHNLPYTRAYATISSSLSFLFILLLSVMLAVPLAAKVTNSVASGDWSAPATWDNGVPANGDQVTISAGHTVTLTAAINFTNAGSTLAINGTLDMGTFVCRVLTNTANAGSTVIQKTTAGGPVAANLRGATLTINPGSTYIYSGNQAGFMGIHPTYGHLRYESVAAGPGVFEINLKTSGNLTINNSGAGEVRFGDALNRSHIIGGDLLILGGNVAGSNGASNVLIDINGKLAIGPGTTFKACAAGGNCTVNLAGNLEQNGTLTSPGAGIFRIAFDGTGNSVISGVAPVSLPNITVTKTGSVNVVLAQHLTIGKNLRFINGLVQLGTFNLTIAPLATITDASAANGYVFTDDTGKLIFEQTNPGADFPVGNGSYTPISLSTTPSNTAYGVRVVNGFLAELSGCSGFVTDDVVKKMWVVTRESGTATILSMDVQWNGSDEGTTFNRNVCGIVQYIGGDWETPVPNVATGFDPYKRGRLFAGLVGGTFGVLDTSSLINITAPTASSNSPLCVGDSLKLKRTSAAVIGATYQWSKLGGGFNPPPGPDANIANVQTSDAGNYQLTLSKYGCNYSSTFVPVIVHPLPDCIISGDVPVCASSTSQVFTGPDDMSTYLWSISGNGSINGSTSGQSVAVDAGGGGMFELTLVVTDANGCSNTCTLEVAIVPRPTGVLSGTTTICPGESTDLSIAVTGTGPWSGMLSDGTMFGGNSSPILVSVTPNMTTTYTLSTLEDANCVATGNDLIGSATVTLDTLDTFDVTGGGAYCDGGDGVEVGLDGSESGVEYQLFLDGNPEGSPVAGTGGAISFGNQTTAGTYTVVATRISTGCTGTMDGSAVVTVNPLPVVTLVLLDDEAFVSETNVPLAGGMPPGGTYSGPGVSGSSINPLAAGLGMHEITYTFTDNNGCSNSATDIFTVIPEPGLNIQVEAPDTVECGEEFFVDIIAAAGFEDIGTLQFSVGWDLNTFMIVDVAPEPIESSIPLTGFISDTLVYSWLDTTGTYGANLPDMSLLMRLTFKALHCKESDSISIIGVPRIIEASDDGYNIVPVTLIPAGAITIEDTMPPAFTDFPDDLSVQCDDVPDVAEPGAEDNCDNEPLVEYLGETTDPGNCPGNYTLTRTWQATDACNNTTTRVQVIEVKDTQPPTFTAPADITVYLDENCEYDASVGVTGDVTDEMDNCTPAPHLDAAFMDEFTPGTGSQGLITRTWKLSDSCGNSASQQVQMIVVRDNTPPELACPGDITVSGGGSNCNFEVANGSLDPTAKDNCGIASLNWQLVGVINLSGSGSLDGIVFTTGMTTVIWTATDIHGLTATCSFKVTVGECQGISGKLIWKGDNVSGVAQAMVELSGDAMDLDGPTLADGLYQLDGAGSNFVITPEKAAPPADTMNGVDAADALILLKHLQNTVLITDPYILIAADVNLDNVVNGTDFVIIRSAHLGSPTYRAIIGAKPWRFVPTPDPGPGFPGYIPPANPFSQPIPEVRTLTGVAGPVPNQNFYGLKMGDLNYDADPLLHPTALAPLVLLVED